MLTRCILLISGLIPSIALGAGAGSIYGVNRVGETVRLNYNYDEPGYTISINKSDGSWERYSSIEECPIWNEEGIQCKSNGRSPLAGASYKMVGNPDPKDCSYAVSYKCISGCDGKSVPLELFEDFWECRNQDCDEGIWRQGIINASDVMLRERPKVASRTVAILQKGDLVDINTRIGKCEPVKIGLREVFGDWLYVSLFIDDKKVSGWVFDALLDQAK